MKQSRNPYYAPQPTSLTVNSTTQFGEVVKGFKDSRISFQFASFLSLSAIVLIGSQSAQAVTKTWDAGGTTSDWSSANNWNTNGVPGSGDDVLVDNVSQPTLENVFLNAAQSINSLTLDLSSNQTWSLGADNNTSASTLTLATGNLTVNSTSGTGTYVIGAVTGTGIGSGIMTLATPASGFTFDNERTNGGMLQINAVVTGTKAVAKTGAGSVIFSGANTYTGATSISSGLLNIQNASALGTIAGATTVSNGAALEIQGGITTLAEALTLNGTGISGGGAFRNISGTNTYAGAITLNSAARINSDTGTLTLNVTSGNAIAGINQDVTFGGAGNVTVADAISIGSGKLAKDGAGTLVLSAANTYTGGTTIDEGVVRFGVAGAIGGSGANVTVNAGGSAATGYAMDQNFLSRVSGSSAGVIALGLNSGNNLNFDTAGLTSARLGASGTFTYSGTLTPNGTTYRVGGGGGALTISTALTGTGNSLNMGLGGTSGGTVILTAANSYGGATVINEGTLTLSGANGSIASSSGVTINSGGNLTLNDQTVNANRIGNVAITLNGGTFGYVSTSGDHAETVGQLSVNTGASTVDSSTTGTGNGDSSVLTFASLARTTGATVNFTDASGTMSAGSNDNNVRFTSTTGLTGTIIGGYATVNAAGWATYTGGGTASVETLGTYVTTTTNGNTATSYVNDNIDVTTSQTPNGVITPNSLRFNSATARTLTLQGTTNTITSGGILVTSTAGAGGTITGGTLRGASGTDLVVHQYSSGNFSINSIIADNTSATGLTKSGTGTLTLGGVNTYTGATRVNGGTLALTGTGSIASSNIIVGGVGSSGAVLNATASGLIVGSSQTVSGIGTIQGSTTIQGILAPGNSAGILNNLGDIELESTSTFQMEIGGIAPGIGGYDQLNVTGAVTLAGLLAVNTGIYVPNDGDLFFVIANDGTDDIAGKFSNANVDDATVVTLGGRQWLISYKADLGTSAFATLTGNDVALMAVPEPNAALIGGIGVLLLLRRRRA